jgi:hypothetical protein
LVLVIGKGNKERQVPLPQLVLIELRRPLEDASQQALAVPEWSISRYALWLDEAVGVLPHQRP